MSDSAGNKYRTVFSAVRGRHSAVLVYVKCHVGMSERQPFSVLVIFVNSVVDNYKALFFYAWKCTSMIMFIVGDLFIIVHRVVQSKLVRDK